MTLNGNEPSRSRDIIVVGAGIAGLALTRQLVSRNFDVVTLERRNEIVDAGLAINLPGNAIAALNELGLQEQVAAAGTPVLKRQYRTDTDRLLFEIDEERFWGRENLPRCLRRSELATILLEGIPHDTIKRRADVASIFSGDDHVEVKTSDGELLRARYLIGADGVFSTVREMTLSARTTSRSLLAQSSWRFIAKNPGVDCWTIWMGRQAMVLLIPVGRDDVYCWATVTDDREEPISINSLVQRTEKFPLAPRRVLEEALSDPARIHLSPIDEIDLPRWGRGRTVLIGDAAHATAPVWAQGAALALEDSLVLSDLLVKNEDGSDLAEHFTQLRRSRVRHVKEMTDRTAKVSHLPVALRNLLFPLLGPLSYKNTYGPLKRSFR
ncbi:FAD-dependent monooxygenase [Agrobacterium sp. DE0009]|uniref:FAD-dependent monooxygenase n=1 Tax=Agrobacterium sp. DE0009 TaxID=2587505 RepID=UPI00119E921F|nr:FAD-dependent monooxygenase [Agrobacterium sp. DE0009]